MAALKIALTGPEGSGKTIMARAISSYFRCPVVEDYCSHYLDRYEGTITEIDLVKIAKGKIKAQEELDSGTVRCIISDNELISLKVWSEFKFNSYNRKLKNLVDSQYYDLYLLIEPDKEPSEKLRREGPRLQNYFFNAYRKELEEKNLPYVVLSGSFYEQKKKAVKAIQKLL